MAKVINCCLYLALSFFARAGGGKSANGSGRELMVCCKVAERIYIGDNGPISVSHALLACWMGFIARINYLHSVFPSGHFSQQVPSPPP